MSPKLSKDNCDEIPDIKTLEMAAAVEVFTESGGQVQFGSIFKDTKTIVVFVRTWHPLAATD